MCKVEEKEVKEVEFKAVDKAVVEFNVCVPSWDNPFTCCYCGGSGYIDDDVICPDCGGQGVY